MADFAVIGYCAYTAWHRAKGTEERRLTRVAKALERGTRSHEGQVERELAEARKLPKATPAHLRNPRINIARSPS